MKKRCLNRNDPSYSYYGGRGITICDRWIDSFDNFIFDLGPKPSKDHSIDRINNTLGYYPENCYWATKKEQARNTRNNIFIEYNGKTHQLCEWAEILNIPKATLWARLNIYHMTVEQAFTSKRYELRGVI